MAVNLSVCLMREITTDVTFMPQSDKQMQHLTVSLMSHWEESVWGKSNLCMLQDVCVCRRVCWWQVSDMHWGVYSNSCLSEFNVCRMCLNTFTVHFFFRNSQMILTDATLCVYGVCVCTQLSVCIQTKLAIHAPKRQPSGNAESVQALW